VKLILPRTVPRPRSAEPMISLVLGAPAAGIGLVVLIAIFVLLVQGPSGKKRFFAQEDLSVMERDSRGVVTYQKPVFAILPSTELLGILSAGLSCATLGIYLSRRRRPNCRVTTCKAGMIACASAFFVLWSIIVVAAFR
jgi:hypothetical protein